jgi:hypothetical protein
MSGCIAQPVNLVPNPGLEADMDVELGSDGKPVEWGTHIGKGKAEFALVDDEAHTGSHSAYVKAFDYNPSGYWVSPRIPVEPGHAFEFSVWYKTRDVQFSARGVTLSLNFRTEDHKWAGAAAEYGTPFTHDWEQFTMKEFAPNNAAYVNIVAGLADSTGEVWFDDFHLAMTDEIRTDMPPTDDILARPFPNHWMPDKTIGVIQGETQPLLFLVQNRAKKERTNSCLGLLLPEGISVVGGDASVAVAEAGLAVEQDGKAFYRWLQPIEGSALKRDTFDYYNGSLVCLEASCEPGKYEVYYFFSSDEETEELQKTTIEVLPPLPEPPQLSEFKIGMLLPDAVRAGGKALDFVDMYARTGMNMVMYGRVPKEYDELAGAFKEHGILRQILLGGTGVVYNVAYGNTDPSIAMINAEGEPNLGGLCPTYTAERGEHFEQWPLEERIAQPVRADLIDGVAINWEPPGAFKGLEYCFCDRCLDRFAEESGVNRAELDQLGPASIVEKYSREWLRFRSRLEGLIAKAYYDKAEELTAEVGRQIWFTPLTGPRMFDDPHPTQERIDACIEHGDVEHPYLYREWIHSYGPFTYAYYDVIAQRWRGHHMSTANYAGEAARFSAAQENVTPHRPVWLGIEGVQKGSMNTLCWSTTPEQMELEIVLALAQGCEGIYIYTGRGMDGYYYQAAARACRRADLMEKDWIRMPLDEDAVSVETDLPGAPPEMFAYARMFVMPGHYLLVLGSLDSKRTVPATVKVRHFADMADVTFEVEDPITDESPSDREKWTGSELANDGFEVSLEPGFVRTYVFRHAQ